ncbi:NADH-quinone oxidoreductase subunit N [Botrimarina hoheduenensis]|uniref:NADH-quinone oxidoreductase subunit N n=1 Tax=Botrimarina hoheduenensis TaxID=2528000 RepID=A0A5C5WCW6_9BACT|nr:NADH-quinone oxidoreductase subunit N [Botrimarina hoheduenensis]TWT48520.1 NADH-quinone oxidoreductase subunit N [Botrimarina hoheduenensis]
MLPTLVEQLAADSFRVSLPAMLPEIALCATIVGMLLAKLLPGLRQLDSFWFALAGTAIAAGLLLREAAGGLGTIGSHELFTGMLVHDPLGVFARGLLLLVALFFVPLVKITGLANRHEAQDLFTLVLGALLGMCLMTRANHLMMVFLAVEMASVPSYVLVGIVKGRRRAGEAALKYSVYGAAAAGVMLYGISLVAGVLGTAHLPTLGQRLVAAASLPSSDEQLGVLMVLALGGVLTLVGIAFKLSAAPFHFWAPDVFAGAPAEVGGFLSTASKAAALVLLVRLLVVAVPHNALLASTHKEHATNEYTVSFASVPPSAAVSDEPVRRFLTVAIAGVALLTCTLGNLAAFGQTNAKRLLAYSTIAHAGYLLMPLAAATQLAGTDPTAANAAIGAMLFYAVGYVFMNLTAFAVVAFIRNAHATENLADYAGLASVLPFVTTALIFAALSLLGLPPLVGFFGKLGVLRSLAEASGGLMMLLLVAAVLNTAASVFYYLRIVKLTCIDPLEGDPPAESLSLVARGWLVLATMPLLLLGLFPETLARLAAEASRGLFG